MVKRFLTTLLQTQIHNTYLADIGNKASPQNHTIHMQQKHRNNYPSTQNQETPQI